MKYSLVKATIKDVKEYRTQYINECLIVFNDININELELTDIVYYYILNREYKKRTNN